MILSTRVKVQDQIFFRFIGKGVLVRVKRIGATYIELRSCKPMVRSRQVKQKKRAEFRTRRSLATKFGSPYFECRLLTAV